MLAIIYFHSISNPNSAVVRDVFLMLINIFVVTARFAHYETCIFRTKIFVNKAFAVESTPNDYHSNSILFGM